MITLRIRNLGGDTRHFDTAFDLIMWLLDEDAITEAELRSIMQRFYSRKPVGSGMPPATRQMVDLQSGEVFEKCKVSACQNETVAHNGLCEHHVINGNPEAKIPKGIIDGMTGEVIEEPVIVEKPRGREFI